MSKPSQTHLTDILAAAGDGDTAARDELWRIIYHELRRVAQNQLAGDALSRKMQPTTLVHETYFRLLGDGQAAWANRRHFFAAAAKAMRRIRIDDARKSNRLKRGGPPGSAGVPPAKSPLECARDGDGEPAVFDPDPTELLALDEALTRLEREDPRKSDIVNLRYFAGLTIDETAEALNLSPRTVDSEWRFARAWLHKMLSAE